MSYLYKKNVNYYKNRKLNYFFSGKDSVEATKVIKISLKKQILWH